MNGLGLALCALVLAGAVREDLAWFAWTTAPLLLLVHDLTHGLLRAAMQQRSRDPAPDADPMHALPALLVAAVVASACAILQSLSTTSTSTVASVITWLVPVLLMGAPPPAAVAWLARQASFCAVTALAALAATQHTHVDVVMQFFGACLAVGLAKVVFAVARTRAPGSRTPSTPDP